MRESIFLDNFKQLKPAAGKRRHRNSADESPGSEVGEPGIQSESHDRGTASQEGGTVGQDAALHGQVASQLVLPAATDPAHFVGKGQVGVHHGLSRSHNTSVGKSTYKSVIQSHENSGKHRNSNSEVESLDSEIGELGRRLDTTELDAVAAVDFCATDDGDSAHEHETGRSLSTGPSVAALWRMGEHTPGPSSFAAPSLSAGVEVAFNNLSASSSTGPSSSADHTYATLFEKFQLKPQAIFTAFSVKLYAAIDGFRHENEQLLLRQSTLEAEAKQFQHELAELRAGNKNEQLLLRQTTLEAEAKQFQHDLAELQAANNALVHEKQQLQLRHIRLEAEAIKIQRELLQSKTLSGTKAQEHTTLLQKYSKLETTMRQMCQQGMQQLETL